MAAMRLLSFMRGPDINRGIAVYLAAPDAVLLDVRSPEEFREGRIPGSLNIPLQQLDKVQDLVENEDIPLYVYCRSGARSRQAAEQLNDMGYTNVTNLGGIAAYSGKLER